MPTSPTMPLNSQVRGLGLGQGQGLGQERIDDVRALEWRVSDGLVTYPDAIAEMAARTQAIADGTAAELIWLLEHPPLYTSGTSARAEDLLTPDRFPVFASGRGGQFTYHGPGQRVVYVMLDLKARGGDVRRYVQSLEAWIIATLNVLGVAGVVREGRIGVWVMRPTRLEGALEAANALREDKIAALGIRVSRGVTSHGIAINVSPDLDHFAGIVPCGIVNHGVTSLADLGVAATMQEVDDALRRTADGIFHRRE